MTHEGIPMLEMRFLGLPQITSDGQPLATFQRSSMLTRLLAFLVIHRDQPQHRFCLAGMFWPELPEPRARRTLNNVLWRLRNALNEADSYQDCLLTEGDTVQFNPQAQFWLDVMEFERLTGALKATGDVPSHSSGEQLREVESAVALYRSDFLEGIYDDWCIPIHERLRERYLLTLDALAQAYQSDAHLDLALETTQPAARFKRCCVGTPHGPEPIGHSRRRVAASQRCNLVTPHRTSELPAVISFSPQRFRRSPARAGG